MLLLCSKRGENNYCRRIKYYCTSKCWTSYDRVQKDVQQVKQKVNEVKNTGVSKQLQSQFDKAGTNIQKYEEQLRHVYTKMDVIQDKIWKVYILEVV